jgi:hypothetical protein
MRVWAVEQKAGNLQLRKETLFRPETRETD